MTAPRPSSSRGRAGKYRRARIRNFLFTVGPHRISRGEITRRHLAKDIVTREIEIASPFWPRAFDGVRIAHVSDFHLGHLLPLEKSLEVVRRVSELQPDFFACTGDIVDLHNDEARPLLDAMSQVPAPFGRFVVLGNHDHLHDAEVLAGMAMDAGLNVLRNEAAQINHNGSRLIVGGLDWARTSLECAQLVDQTCGDYVHLLLAHNPRAFLRAADLGVPLTLSGHTHGGQVAMRDRPTANLALLHRRTAGLYDSHGSRLYVTTGVGSWFPLRVNCPAEIALLTVRHAEVPVAEIGNRRKRRKRR